MNVKAKVHQFDMNTTLKSETQKNTQVRRRNIHFPNMLQMGCGYFPPQKPTGTPGTELLRHARVLLGQFRLPMGSLSSLMLVS